MPREQHAEMLYKKSGNRYYPIKEFTGFPHDGLWFVQKSRNSLVFGVDQIHLFSSKESHNLVHELESFRKPLVDGLIEELNKWQQGSLESPNDIVTTMIRKVLESELKKSLS